MPQVFSIYHCSVCDTSFAHPKTNAESIYELIYKNGSNVLWYDRYWKYALDVKIADDPLDYLARSEDTYWAVKQALETCPRGAKPPKVLEVGSGLGYLTYALNRAGYDATGLDISAEAVARSKKSFGLYYTCGDVRRLDQGYSGKYDVVVFTELIEHIDDIIGFLKCVLRLLKPNGRLVLTTPNKSLFPSNVIWATDLPPVHWWWLSENSIVFVANYLGLKLSFTDFTQFNDSNCRSIAKREAYRVPFMQPFDSHGKLLNVAKPAKGLLSRIKSVALSISIFREIKRYFDTRRQLQLLKEPGRIYYGKRGNVLCATLMKR